MIQPKIAVNQNIISMTGCHEKETEDSKISVELIVTACTFS